MNQVRELFELASGNTSDSYNHGSRAASAVQEEQQEPKEDRVITEVINGIITSRPAKKFQHLNESKETEESGPEIIELGGKSKAASSTQSVNEVAELFAYHIGSS